eukprot:850306-Rhodomonas_salina.1
MAMTQPFLQNLGLSWTAPGLKAPKAVANALGIRKFDARLVLDLLRSVSVTHWHSASDVDLAWLVRVLASLHGDTSLHKCLLWYVCLGR